MQTALEPSAPPQSGRRLPTFVVIGAAKAGTTALYHLLRQHPQVYLTPSKETNFFALENRQIDFRGPGDAQHIGRVSLNRLSDYQEQFAGLRDEIAWGEASPLYLYHPDAPERILRHVPEVKLIVILRDPVERAFSSYLHLRRDNREPLTSFSEALAAEPDRIRQNWEFLWHYRAVGRYSEQLQRYYDRFDASQIHVCLYEQFQTDPAAVLRNLFGFLGVDRNVEISTGERYNVSRVPRSNLIAGFIARPHWIKELLKPLFPARARQRATRLLSEKNSCRPELSPELRRQLVDEFAGERERTARLCGLDLSLWTVNS